MSRHHDAIKNDPRYREFRDAVLEAAGHACEQCGATEDLTADHVIALDNGGDPFDLSNGRCLCRTCNSRKGNRPDEMVRANYFNTKYLTNL